MKWQAELSIEGVHITSQFCAKEMCLAGKMGVHSQQSVQNIMVFARLAMAVY